MNCESKDSRLNTYRATIDVPTKHLQLSGQITLLQNIFMRSETKKTPE
jgi:hypothetical protein